jgi:hypothetical protein
MAPLINLSWHDYLDQAGAFEPGYVFDMGAAREAYPRLFETGWQVLQTAYSPATLDWERLKPSGEHPIFSEPFPSCLCLAGLQNVDGFGELTGAPWAAAELPENPPGLEPVLSRS